MSLERRYAFGAGLDLDLLGFELDGSTLVPGVAVAPSRAKPLATKAIQNVYSKPVTSFLFPMFLESRLIIRNDIILRVPENSRGDAAGGGLGGGRDEGVRRPPLPGHP